MNLMKLMVAVCLALLSGACLPSREIQFDTGAAYHSPYVVDEEAIVSFPDSILERVYRVRAGGGFFWERQIYKIPVYELFRAETQAHLKGIFRRGVTVSNHSATDLMEPMPGPMVSDQEESRSLEEILDELNRKEEGDEEIEKSESELNEELQEALSRRVLEERDARYLIWYNNAILTMGKDRRVVISFDVDVRDRRTGVSLLQKRYTGRSRRFDPGRNLDTNTYKLEGVTRQTFSGIMKQFIADLATVTDARR